MSLLILIIGKRGFGKTYLNDRLTARLALEASQMPVYAVRTAHDLDGNALPGRATLYTDPTAALDAVYKRGRPNFILSISEAQNVAGGRADYYDGRMRRLIFEGRHVGAHLIVDTQRASSVTTDLYSQATDIFSFRQEYPGDLQRLEEWTGDPRHIEIVRGLPPHAFFSFRDGETYALK